MTKWLLVFIVPQADFYAEILWDHKEDCINSVPQVEMVLKMEWRPFRGKRLSEFAQFACVPQYEWESE